MEYVSGGDLMWHIQRQLFSESRAKFDFPPPPPLASLTMKRIKGCMHVRCCLPLNIFTRITLFIGNTSFPCGIFSKNRGGREREREREKMEKGEEGEEIEEEKPRAKQLQTQRRGNTQIPLTNLLTETNQPMNKWNQRSKAGQYPNGCWRTCENCRLWALQRKDELWCNHKHLLWNPRVHGSWGLLSTFFFSLFSFSFFLFFFFSLVLGSDPFQQGVEKRGEKNGFKKECTCNSLTTLQ